MMKGRLLIGVLAVATTILVTGCKDGDKGPSNYFKVDGSTKSLKSGLFFTGQGSHKDDASNTVYENELALLSSGFVVSGTGDVTGKGNAIDITLTSANETELVVGTYEFSDSETSAALHFTGTVLVDFTASSSTPSGTTYDILSGTVKIAKSGTAYTVDFDGTVSLDGTGPSKSATAHFSGLVSTFASPQ